MAAMLYFVPGHKGPVTREMIKKWGLSHAFDGIPYYAEMSGPGGGGTMLANDSALKPYIPRYMPNDQRWKKFPGSHVHVGHYLEAKPGPSDLTRPDVLPGLQIRLEDGNEWTVPIVFFPKSDGTPTPALPRYLDLDESGKPTPGDVLREYQWLQDVCTPFWEAWLEGFNTALEKLMEDDHEGDVSYTISHKTMPQDAASVLSANYRIGLAEVVLLRLFRTDRSACDVLKLACDCVEAEVVLLGAAYQKKAEAGEPETSDALVGSPA